MRRERGKRRPAPIKPGMTTYADRLIENNEGRLPGIKTLYEHWGMLYATGQRMRHDGKHDEAIKIEGESDSVRDLIEHHYGFDEDVAELFLDEAHYSLNEDEQRRKRFEEELKKRRTR